MRCAHSDAHERAETAPLKLRPHRAFCAAASIPLGGAESFEEEGDAADVFRRKKGRSYHRRKSQRDPTCYAVLCAVLPVVTPDRVRGVV